MSNIPKNTGLSRSPSVESFQSFASAKSQLSGPSVEKDSLDASNHVILGAPILISGLKPNVLKDACSALVSSSPTTIQKASEAVSVGVVLTLSKNAPSALVQNAYQLISVGWKAIFSSIRGFSSLFYGVFGGSRDKSKAYNQSLDFLKEMPTSVSSLGYATSYGKNINKLIVEYKHWVTVANNYRKAQATLMNIVQEYICSKIDQRNAGFEIDSRDLARLTVSTSLINENEFPEIFSRLQKYENVKELRLVIERAKKDKIFFNPHSETYLQKMAHLDVLFANEISEEESQLAKYYVPAKAIITSGLAVATVVNSGGAVAVFGKALAAANAEALFEVAAARMPQILPWNSSAKNDRKKWYLTTHKSLQTKSRKEIGRLPLPVYERLNDIDMQIREAIEQSQFKEAKNLMKRREGLLVGFPTSPKILRDFIGSSNDHKKELVTIDLKIKNFLNDYSYIEGLPSLVESIRQNSIAHADLAAKTMIFLNGPPGVGKTRFAEQLSKALNVNYCRLQVSGDNADEFLPVPSQPGMMEMFSSLVSDDLVLLKKIPYTFTVGGHTNPVLLFDEVGDRMDDNQFAGASQMMSGFQPMFPPTSGSNVQSFLTFFDHATKGISVPSLGQNISFDWTRATVIFAGNKLPTSAAMLSRLQVIEFPALSKDKKAQIMWDKFNLCLQLDDDLDDKTAKALKAAYGIIIEKVVQYEAKIKMPGVRISEMLAAKMYAPIKNYLNQGIKISYELFEADILAHYVGQQGIES